MLQNTTLSFIGFLLLLSSGLQAQYASVDFDYESAYFNQGQPLPAETNMMISGAAASDVYMVEVQLFKEKADWDHPIFVGTWKRAENDKGQIFKVAVNEKLRGNTAYNFRFFYFEPVNNTQLRKLKSSLSDALEAYLQQAFILESGKYKLRQSSKSTHTDLENIIFDALERYRAMDQTTFHGLSTIIETALDHAEQRVDSTQRGVAAIQKDLLGLIQSELTSYMEAPLVMRTDVREVRGYETESTRRTLSVNVGYGGVFIDRLDNGLVYGASPYVGLSFPLGNQVLGGPFWRNTSISVGAFTQNFEGQNGEVITGPIFGRPYFVGLGYNLFRFIRINAGATALATQEAGQIGGGSATFDVNNITLNPFLGISAEFDLWVGVKEKR